MEKENSGIIGDVTQAVIFAREAVNAGLMIPIKPCAGIDATGQVHFCPNLDKTAKTVCRHEDGLLQEDGQVQCPRQKGTLTLTELTDADIRALTLKPMHEVIKPNIGRRSRRARKQTVHF